MSAAQDVSALDIFKELLWDSILKAALAKLLAKSVILSWGPVAALITWVVTSFSDDLYVLIKTLITIELIVYRNKQLQVAYGNSANNLKNVALSKGIDSAEFRKARDENKNHLSAFVMYDTVRP